MSLGFDENIAKQLEVAYQKADVLRRRALVRDALDARPGENVIDVGCGPGFYVAELAETVGPSGSVLGVDSSPQMLAAAAKRSEPFANVSLEEAQAQSLPAADESFDAAVSVQVLEYVRDIPAALIEMRRVLRPGGRVVIWDVDWSTLSWQSSDDERMQRVLRAWEEHLVHPSLPRVLGGLLRDAGFGDVHVDGHAFVNADASDETYSSLLIPLVVDFAAGRNGLMAVDTSAWREDLYDLAGRGAYFFSIVQFCFTARRPE